MIYVVKCRKAIACFFLCLSFVQLFVPLPVKALTSGPSQPETKQFSPAGAGDMVDLFTGGFKYNIPLLDIDGYPLNLNYASGVGMDDEASWVGLGWNLNVGAINRQLRGIPDDFSGDSVITEHYTKPNICIGGRGTVKVEVVGFNALGLSGSLSLGVFSDNYRGIGAEVGANAGISAGQPGSMLTGSLGVGLNSNTSSGVDVTPYASLGVHEKATSSNTAEMGLSASLGYNTRQGLKALSLGTSFGVSGKDKDGNRGSSNYDVASSTISYNTPPFTPAIGIGYKNTSATYSIDIGGAEWVVFEGGGLTGYKTVREIIASQRQDPEYGFLYAHRAKDRDSAMLDFMREKDNPIITALPNLAVPITTPDLFSYTGQAGSGQFRLYRNSAGIINDAVHSDISTGNTDGLDLGFGGYFHGGVTFYNQDITDRTGKWRQDNAFNKPGDYQDAVVNSGQEAAYFKLTGEKNVSDPAFVNAIQGENAVRVKVDGKTAAAALKVNNMVYNAPAAYKKQAREIRRTPVTYLTAGEMPSSTAANLLSNYRQLSDTVSLAAPDSCGSTATAGTPVAVIPRTYNSRPHHLSEITVHGDDGKRMVYGLPVYNTKQDEYSFATYPLPQGTTDAKRNLTPYTVSGGVINHTFGTDNYYHHESMPSYATSFLLTSVLSPDYVDVTSNGVTDDDLGTAVKFNYSKVPKPFKWRSPYDSSKALYNRALNADPDDDKGSIVYGEKDLWYLHSIETKTKIIYFITEDRDDALGVTGVHGGKDVSVRQRLLKEIRMYAKSDRIKPIKTVVFQYDYSLCTGVPNVVKPGQGKLTLKKVYFKYGTSTKGAHHPYTFDYNAGAGQSYDYLSADRWGTKKASGNNALAGLDSLRNDRFPYSVQNADTANYNASMWNISKITMPSGGIISVDYEAGDYAYVQNQRAMQMVKIQGLINTSGQAVTNLKDAAGFIVNIDDTLQAPKDAGLTNWVIKNVLNGHKEMYAKLFVNMTDDVNSTADANYDYVPCYGIVSKAELTGARGLKIYFQQETNGGVTSNPFIFSAWQKMRSEYPRYAYPGYKNRVSSDMAVSAALHAIVNALGNLSELWQNFNQRASNKGFANKVDLAKSFARVVKVDGKKKGGGARVKRIQISDAWADMTGNSKYKNSVYGQAYEYTMQEGGRTISSGVASYEPGIGNDENPLHLPVPYAQNIKGALSNEFYLEQPFVEGLFPGPQVGYSHVTVRDLDENHVADPMQRTGYAVHDFYTARDFPVEVSSTDNPLVSDNHPSSGFGFFGANIKHEVSMSQGYVIRLNDMHGKPKGDYVYNMSNQQIASTDYHYSSEIADAGKLRLKNDVDVIDEKGVITTGQTIGREIEMYGDMRESKSDNVGKTIQIGGDVVPGFFGIPFPIPHWPRKVNTEHVLLRTACVLKTVQYTGMIDSVTKVVNGSKVVSKNLLYDKYTGEPVVTQTANEFDDPVYSVNMPAYWAYGKMGPAYKNLNAVLKDFATDANGVIAPAYTSLLASGDELLDLQTGQRFWVAYSGLNGGTTSLAYRLIDAGGNLIMNYKSDIKIYRSGYRNQLGSSTASYSTLVNPISGSSSKIFDLAADVETQDHMVLDAKTTLYDEKWGQQLPCLTCPAGYTLNADNQCTKAPTTAVNANFSLVVGDKSIFYGDRGAFVYNASNVVVDSFRNDVFGGACNSGGATLTAVNDSIALAKQLLKTAAVTGASSSVVTPSVSVSTNCGRLLNTGIWWGGTTVTDTIWRGVMTCFTVPAGSGDIYVGLGADNRGRLYIDDVLVDYVADDPYNNLEQWRLKPFHAGVGKHTLRVEAQNRGTEHAIAFDLYNTNNAASLKSATAAQLQAMVILNSSMLLQQADALETYVINANGTKSYHYSCGTDPVNVCDSPFACGTQPILLVNPYTTGFLGNWRPSEDKIFEVNLSDQQLFTPGNPGPFVRKSGYYVAFTPYWSYNSASMSWGVAHTNAGKWVSNRYITLYDKYGQELENHDALGRYSGAIYGYKGQLATAVATNAQQREIFYDGFDDYQYRNLCGTVDACSADNFSIYKATGTSWLDSTVSHSGRYSIKLKSQLQLKTPVFDLLQRSTEYLTTDNMGRYLRQQIVGLYPNGFSPVAGKQYVFSAWVNDANALSDVPGITVTANGSTVAITRKATAEGWKLVEGIINVPLGSTQLLVNISGGSDLHLDDVRIFPFDAEIKTYAYDDQTLRLMAELDENNLATFYEYDDEGTLIRVKKETDRGIMTIKENRSVYRRTQN